MSTQTINEKTSRSLIINRTFNAPVSAVWKAWSDAGMQKKWWGPEGFTCPEAKVDFRESGRYLNCMRSADGQEIWSTGEYREIVPEQRFVVTDSFADANGNVVPASHYNMPGAWPRELTVTVTFEEDNGKTKMTLQHDGLPGEVLEECKKGWSQSFDKLESLLKNNVQRKQFKVEIDAPREKVWKVLWDDATYREWTSVFSPGSHAVSDWRKGSKIHFLDGEGRGMTSVISDLVPDEYMSFTHKGEVKDGAEDFSSAEAQGWNDAQENYTLREVNGKTELIVDLDVAGGFAEYFEGIFPKALAAVKQIAERK